MKLLPNEQKLITSSDDDVILTDHRIYMTEKVLGQSYTISIFLEDIRSIEIKYKSKLIFIVLGVLFFLAGVFLSGQSSKSELFLAGLIISIIFLGLWMITRKHIISVKSISSSSLDVPVHNMSEDKINNFVHAVSVAKQKRINQLHKI